MGKLLKRVGRTPAVQRMVGATLAAHIGLVRRTTRWKTIGEDAARGAWAGETPVIVAFWHNRLAMMPYCWPSARPFHMLISAHPDGQLIARTVRHFGIETVAGSSTRGGSEALRSLVRLIKSGVSVGITPDGPRGPRNEFKPGAILLAQLSGKPIVPIAYAAARARLFRTWDRFVLPWPFTRIAIAIGEPRVVPKRLDGEGLERWQREMAAELQAQFERARMALNRPTTPCG